MAISETTLVESRGGPHLGSLDRNDERAGEVFGRAEAISETTVEATWPTIVQSNLWRARVRARSASPTASILVVEKRADAVGEVIPVNDDQVFSDGGPRGPHIRWAC